MFVHQVYAPNIAGLDFSLGLTASLMVSLWLRWWNVGWMRVMVLCICSWLNSWIQSVDYWMDVTAHVLNAAGVVERSHKLIWAWLRVRVWHCVRKPGRARMSSSKPQACCPETGRREEDQMDPGWGRNKKKGHQEDLERWIQTRRQVSGRGARGGSSWVEGEPEVGA